MGKYREPINYTCPDIDVIVEKAKEIQSICKSPEEDAYELNYDWISDLASDIISQIEDLRSSNSTLRDWGNDINDELENIESENDKLQQKIEDLEEEINDLTNEVKELRKGWKQYQ